MAHDPIPQHILAELAAAWAMLERCRRPNQAAAVVLRLSVDRSDVSRLEAQAFEGMTLRAVIKDAGSG